MTGPGAALLVLLLGGLAWTWERGHRRTRAMAGGLHTDISLPHDQEFELYHNALSLCSTKVRVCLAELGIDYASHHIDLIETGSYENIGRHFLKVNPAGTVPVLVHDGHPIYESHEQIRHAAAHAPAGDADPHPLVPDDADLRAQMEAWIDRTSLVGDDPVAEAHATAGNAIPGLTVPLFVSMIADIAYIRIVEGLLFHRLKMRPLLFIAMKLGGFRGLKHGPARSVVAGSGRHMAKHLDALEAQLAASGGPWILGDAFTLADVGWVPILQRLTDADSIHCFVGEGLRPNVKAYWEALKRRPSYRAAVVDHTHETVERGATRLRDAKRADPALRTALENF